MSKVTPHEGTPLKLEKKLFKRTYTKKGPVLEPVKDGARRRSATKSWCGSCCGPTATWSTST